MKYAWLNQESRNFLAQGYLSEGERAEDRIEDIAYEANALLYSQLKQRQQVPVWLQTFRKDFLHGMERGWYSLSSPVWSNFGKDRGLPISCFGSYVPDSMDGILDTASEIGMMSKYGGGTSAYFGDVRPRGAPIQGGANGHSDGSVNFMRLFDTLSDVTKQGSVRRGSTAVYLPIDHDDIEEFLDIRDDGNPIQLLSFGVTISDSWMHSMIAGDMDKRRVWAKVLSRRSETGMPYIMFSDAANAEGPYSDSRHKILASNLCVSPDTEILTREYGYVPIKHVVDTEVDVWNGEEWSTTTPRVTNPVPTQLLKVTTNSTRPLDVTPEHIFYVKKDYSAEAVPVQAKDLKPGDKLIKFDLPVIEGELDLLNAYASGFYSGDGTKASDGNSRIYLYNDKRKLLPLFDGVYESVYVQDDQDRISLEKCKVANKFDVPGTLYTVQARLEWLAGLLDSDGTVARNGENESFQIGSTNPEFLYEVQLMLQTLGVNAKVTKSRDAGRYEMPANDGTGGLNEYDCKATYRLLISSSGVFTLKNLGLKTYRLKWVGREPQRNAEQYIVVESVEEGIISTTMCFTEEKRHMGMFNGVLTGQCSEIMLPSNEDESFVCCLSSMNLAKWDEWKDTNAVEVLTYFLDAVMEEFIRKSADLPGLRRAHKFAKNHRALGLGALGWHSLLQQKFIPFGSLIANSLNNHIFRHINEATNRASNALAVAYGQAPVAAELKLGRRNTTLMAVAPTASSSFILGQVSPSIEPLHSNYHIKGLAKTTHVYRNPELEKYLEELDMNNAETWASILRNDGSVQHLDIPDDAKEVFKTFAEISQLDIIVQAATRQQWIDQGQSLNLMIHPDTPARDISQLYIEAWERGLKSLYYQHSINAAQKYNRDLLNCTACEA